MIHLTPFDLALWFAQFLLEAAGALLAYFRFRHIWPLWMFLSARALGDILTAAVLYTFGPSAYNPAFWLITAVLYIPQGILALHVAARLVPFRNPGLSYYAGWFASIAVGCVTWAYCGERLLTARMLTAEIAVNLTAAALICGAGLLRQISVNFREIGSPLNGITFGLLVLMCSDCASAFLQKHFGLWRHWDIIARTFPAGEIAALIVFVVALLSARNPAEVARLELSPRVESVSIRLKAGI